MSYFNRRTSSGIFTWNGRGYSEYKDEILDRSINGISIALGYHPDQTYSPVSRFEKNPTIFAVVYEIFTRNVIFVLTTPQTTFLTEKDVKKYLGDFSVTKEFNSLKIGDVLETGIENCTLSIEFLARVLKLKNISRNGMFYSDRIKAYLYFTNGILTNFQYDDGFFPWAKHVKEVNSTIYNWLSTLAYKYWPNDEFQAKKEINIQCEAWSAIPEAFGNEFIPLHRTENGGANLHMIRVCHYNYPITLSQFKEINHGRFEQQMEDSASGYTILKCGLFLYLFEISSELLLKAEFHGNT
jgi:hypothetical protein